MEFENGLSHREVATSLGLSPGTIGKLLSRVEASGLGAAATPALPDFAKMHVEYRRVGVAPALLQSEYAAQQPGGYGYTQFFEFYRRWLGQRGLVPR